MQTAADPERVINISDVCVVFFGVHCLMFVLFLSNGQHVIAYFYFKRMATTEKGVSTVGTGDISDCQLLVCQTSRTGLDMCRNLHTVLCGSGSWSAPRTSPECFDVVVLNLVLTGVSCSHTTEGLPASYR